MSCQFSSTSLFVTDPWKMMNQYFCCEVIGRPGYEETLVTVTQQYWKQKLFQDWLKNTITTAWKQVQNKNSKVLTRNQLCSQVKKMSKWVSTQSWTNSKPLEQCDSAVQHSPKQWISNRNVTKWEKVHSLCNTDNSFVIYVSFLAPALYCLLVTVFWSLFVVWVCDKRHNVKWHLWSLNSC